MNKEESSCCPQCLTSLITRNLEVSQEQRTRLFRISEELVCVQGHVIGISYLVPVAINSLAGIKGYRNEAIRQAQGLPPSKWANIRVESTRQATIKPDLWVGPPELKSSEIRGAINTELAQRYRYPAIKVMSRDISEAPQTIQVREPAPKKSEAASELILLNPGERRLK